MNILIATGLYPPDIGGPATYTKFLERHLPAQGIAFKVVAFTHVRSYPKIIRHVLYLFRLLRSGRDADVLYALDTISVGIPVWLASKILRKKYYLRVPGDYAWEQGQQRWGVTVTLDEYVVTKEKPFPARVLSWLQSRVARSATRVVVPSDYMKTIVGAWGVDKSRVVRIYSALNPIQIEGTYDSLRKKYEYQDFTVITAARLTPWKGIEALIDVVCMLRGAGQSTSLEILGSGELQKQLGEYIIKKEATTFVHLRGQVGKTELAERIKAADAFVLNTSYEGLSHQLLEVMEIGVPIVTTPVGGNRELIEHEVHGLLVPWNDRVAFCEALTRIRTDMYERDRMVKAGQEKVKLFREEVIVPQIATLFTRVSQLVNKVK